MKALVQIVKYVLRPQVFGIIVLTIYAAWLGSTGANANNVSQALTGIIILVTVLTGWLIETRFEETQISGKAELRVPDGFNGFFKDRNDIEPSISDFPNYVFTAKEEVFVVGVSAVYLTLYKRPEIRNKTTQGCKFRFLLPDSSMRQQIADHFNDKAYPQSFETSLEAIREIARLPECHDKIEARQYSKALPTLGLTFLDPTKSYGKALVELNPYHFSNTERPSFQLSKGSLFDSLYTRYMELWKDPSTKPLNSI